MIIIDTLLLASLIFFTFWSLGECMNESINPPHDHIALTLFWLLLMGVFVAPPAYYLIHKYGGL